MSSQSPGTTSTDHETQSAIYDPQSFITASAAYALITPNPAHGHGGGYTMPPLPDSALALDAARDRLALIATRCELILLENVDRLATRAIISEDDVKKFDLATLFLYRLTAIRKSLKELASPTPSPSDHSAFRNPQSAFPSDDSAIRNPKSEMNPPPPTVAPVRSASISTPSVSSCPAYSLETAERLLDHTAADLGLKPELATYPLPLATHSQILFSSLFPDPQSLVPNAQTTISPASPPSDTEVAERFKTSEFLPELSKVKKPDAPYKLGTCPDCARCCFSFCGGRTAHPGFVTCNRDCPSCDYAKVCPWCPRLLRPG